jgi:hypothetical protein
MSGYSDMGHPVWWQISASWYSFTSIEGSPSTKRVKFCALYNNSSIDAPFQVIASGTNRRGQVKTMELGQSAAGKGIHVSNVVQFRAGNG